MRVVCALLALLVVGAYAQDNFYSHVVAGSFSRGAPVQVANGLARWDSAAKQWFGTAAGRALGIEGTLTVRDIEVATNDIVFLLVSDDNNDRVVQYTVSTEKFVVFGDEVGKNQINDLVIIGDRVYICGAFNLARPKNDQATPAQRTDVINIGYLNVAPDNRLLWNQIPPSAEPTQATPACSRLFGFSDRLLMANLGGVIYWRTPAANWISNTSDTSVSTNLRGAGGASVVSIGNTFVEGSTLYISTSTHYRFNGATEEYRIVSTTDGLNYQGVLRIDEVSWTTGDPRRFFVELSNFAVIGSDVIFPAIRTNGTRTYWAMFKAPKGTLNSIPTRIGDPNVYFGSGTSNTETDMVSGFHAGQSGFIVDGTKMIFHTGVNVPVVYTEAVYSESEHDADLVFFRKASRLSNLVSFDVSSATFAIEGAGGIGGSVSKAVKIEGSIWFVGGFTTAYNKRWLGLAGYNENKKEWTALGDPISDWLRMPRAIDSSSSPIAGASLDATEPPAIKAVHHFPAGVSNANYIIIAGNFRRIGNETFNGLAWMRTDDVTKWNPLGSIGIHDNTADLTYLHRRSAGISTFVKPGIVLAITSTAGKGTGGRTLWLGGQFVGSGASRSELPLNNVAKYAFGDEAEKVFSSLGGGVNGPVFAIDAVGSSVFVGGTFNRAGNLTAHNIAMWDDAKQVWNTMQTGVTGTVRQIIARSANDVFVLTTGTSSVAGGVKGNNNIQRWDGTKWSFIECDVCADGCLNRNARVSCTGSSATTAEIRYIGNSLYRRTTTGAIHYWDNGSWRNLAQSQIGASGDYGHFMSRGVSGNRFLVANSNNGLASDWSPMVSEVDYDVNENNVYPIAGAGFDGPISQLSGAASVAPVMALVAIVLAAVMLF